MKIIIILWSIYVSVSMFEISIEKTELVYVNYKYFHYLDYSLSRKNRRSPYVFNVYQSFKFPVGNNLTYIYTLYEVISGREILTPVKFVLPLCNALKSEQYIGKLFADQLPKDWVCPFPAGSNNWTNIELNFSNWPFLPFTYSSLYVRVCTTVDAYINNELAHQGKLYAALKQKLQDSNSKKKS